VDRATQVRALRAAIEQAGIKPELARVAAHFDIERVTWAEMPDADVDTLYRFTIGGEPLPAADPSMTPDDTTEGTAFNQSIPF